MKRKETGVLMIILFFAITFVTACVTIISGNRGPIEINYDDKDIRKGVEVNVKKVSVPVDSTETDTLF